MDRAKYLEWKYKLFRKIYLNGLSILYQVIGDDRRKREAVKGSFTHLMNAVMLLVDEELSRYQL